MRRSLKYWGNRKLSVLDKALDKAKRQRQMFEIRDWADNRMFPEVEFETAEDGHEFIAEKFTEDELQDIFVVPKKPLSS